MSHDDFDDGLVHGHGWATEPPAPVLDRLAPVIANARDAAAAATAMQPDPSAPFDDGLVHGHAWASGEGSQPAGAK
jgi:hypothetical protein